MLRAASAVPRSAARAFSAPSAAAVSRRNLTFDYTDEQKALDEMSMKFAQVSGGSGRALTPVPFAG